MYGIRGSALRTRGPIHQRGNLTQNTGHWSIPTKQVDDLSNIVLVSSLRAHNELKSNAQNLISHRNGLTPTPQINNHSSGVARSEHYTESILFEDDVDEFSHDVAWGKGSHKSESYDDFTDDHECIMQHALNVYNEQRTKELLSPKKNSVPKRQKSAHIPTSLSSEFQRTFQVEKTLSSVSLYLPRTRDKTPSQSYTHYRNVHRPNSASKFRSCAERQSEKSILPRTYGIKNVRLAEMKASRKSDQSGLLSARSSSSVNIREETDIDNGIINAVGVANGIATGPSKQKQVLLPQKVDIANKSHVSFNFGGLDKNPKKRPEYKLEGPCFARYPAQTKPYFTIHPEWVSENLCIKGMSLTNKRPMNMSEMLPPPRRCKSAPPPRSRNPITWENW